jgi:hypothetical protein
VRATFAPRSRRTALRRIPGTDLALLADGYATVTAVRPLGHLDDMAIPTDTIIATLDLP